jgi:hypothetical protein
MSEINKAIAKVMSEVGSVRKEGTNTFHNYKFAAAADILHKLQPLSAAAGLIIFQNEKNVEMLFGDSVIKVTYEFSLAHANGEERAPIIRSGVAAAKNTKGGFDDKALNKCSTAALKYFLLNLFQIPTGDYDDADKDEDKPAKLPSAKPHRLEPRPPQLDEEPSAAALAYVSLAKTALLNAQCKEDVDSWWRAETESRSKNGVLGGTAAFDEVKALAAATKYALPYRDMRAAG